MLFAILFSTIIFFCMAINANNEIKCKINITNDLFKWEYFGSPYTISSPICWENNTMYPILRRCDPTTGKWLPQYVTCSNEEHKNSFCPEDLTEITVKKNRYICLKVSAKPQSFDDTFCYGSDAPVYHLTQHERIALFKYLQNNKINRFWLPFRRSSDNKLSEFLIRLPGKLWGNAANLQLNIDNLISHENCLTLSYDPKSFKHTANNSSNFEQYALEMKYCSDDIAYSVCIFKKHLITTSGCPKNFGALSHHPNKCYGVIEEANKLAVKYHPLTISTYFNNRNAMRLILKKLDLLKDFIVIDTYIDDIQGTYVMLMNKKEEVRMLYRKDRKYFILTSKVILKKYKVEMILKMDQEDLKLVVYNRHYIWNLNNSNNDYGIKCFTNADYDELKSVNIDLIWENDKMTISVFKIKLVGDMPGEYWCEAHTIFDFELVTTQRFIATDERRGHLFAMQFNIPCIDDEFNNLCINLHSNFKRLSKKLLHMLKDCKNDRFHSELFRDLQIHTAHIMAVEDYKNLEIVSRVHVAISLKSSTYDNREEQSSEEDGGVEIYPSIRYDTTVHMQQRDLLIQMLSNCYHYSINSVRSTEYCFPEIFKVQSRNEDNQWLLAKRGQIATTLKLCLKPDGVPQIRKCTGNFITGAHWIDPNEDIVCISKEELSDITNILYNLDKSKLSKSAPLKAIRKLLNIIKHKVKQLIPADLYYMANIIKSSVKTITQARQPNITKTNNLMSSVDVSLSVDDAAQQIVKIYNYLMDVNKRTIRSSIVLNSTNIFLDAFENLIDKASLINDFKKENEISLNREIDIWEFADVGVEVHITDNFVIFTIDPAVANVSGVAIYRDLQSIEQSGYLGGAFSGEFYRFLQTNHTIDDLLNIPNLQLGTYVPATLLARVHEISAALNNTYRTEPIIVIKIYANDKFFQEDDVLVNHTVSGRVISISLPGYSSDLPEILPFVLHINSNEYNDNYYYDSQEDQYVYKFNSTVHTCSYWNYKNWATDGLVFLGRSINNSAVIICGCKHLTPFAYLVGGSYFSGESDDIGIITSAKHEHALDIITVIGCSLSIFGIICVFITAATFYSWRQKASSKVLLHLSTAIILQMTIFCFVNTEQYSKQLKNNVFIFSCVTIGAILQYSVLVQFGWMLVIGYLQFKRYVQVFGNARPKRFFIKMALLCWGLPLIPVLIAATVDKKSFSKDIICYPSGYALYFGVAFPIAIIILTNFVIFCIVLCNIIHGPNAKIRSTERNILISQIRLSVILFFLLGFTWIFGFMAAMKFNILFSYLFSLTATLQGFIIFLYFIVLDPFTNHMWRNCFRQVFGFGKIALGTSTNGKEITQSF